LIARNFCPVAVHLYEETTAVQDNNAFRTHATIAI